VQVVRRKSARPQFAFFWFAARSLSWRRLQGLAWRGYVTQSRFHGADVLGRRYGMVRTESILRGLLRILPYHDASNILPARLA
jgi:hypothetical protein